MAWTTAKVAKIDDQKASVTFYVEFGRDDSNETVVFPFTAKAELRQISVDWLSEQATSYINGLNGLETTKGIQQGDSIPLKIPPPPPTPNPERDAYLALLGKLQQYAGLLAPLSMLDAAKADRDKLKAQAEDGYKKEYFGL